MEGYCVWLVLLLSANVHSIRAKLTSRGFDPEDGELLVRILSVKAAEVSDLLQRGRQFLHKIREWHVEHPAESLLAKCVLDYWFQVKIPEIVAMTDEDTYEFGKRGLSSPVWIEPETSGNFQAVQISNRISEMKPHPRFIDDGDDLKFKRTAVKALYLLSVEVKNFLSEYKLIGCSANYLAAKFWEWVDRAR